MDVMRHNTRAKGQNGQKKAIDSLIERIAEEIATQVATQQAKKLPKTDNDLRSLLRKELELHVEDDHGKFVSAVESVDQVHSVRSFECSTASCASAVTNVTGGCRCRAPMDIFHPSFWSEEDKVERTESVECDSVNPACRMNAFTLHLPFVDVSKGHRMHSSTDELSDENGSVLSDITGLNENVDDSTRAQVVSITAPSTKLPAAANQLLSAHDNGSSIFGSQTKSNTTVSSDNSKKRRKKRAASFSVSFRDVHVREYERIMCDNPACSTGPSIGIGWNYEPNDPVPLEDYELLRRRQRSAGELILSRSRREKLIRDLGYGDRDIASVVRELNKLRYHRRQTVNNLGAQKMEEAVENATRRVKRIFLHSRN